MRGPQPGASVRTADVPVRESLLDTLCSVLQASRRSDAGALRRMSGYRPAMFNDQS
jgi:hypothetical protein